MLYCVAGLTPKKDHGQSLLQVAFKSGNLDIADYLIESGIDLNFIEASYGDEEWSAEIKEFWDNTFPIILSVGCDYQYFAIKLDSGEVVQGWEPEFEYPSVVAESFEDFLEKVVVGEIILVG